MSIAKPQWLELERESSYHTAVSLELARHPVWISCCSFHHDGDGVAASRHLSALTTSRAKSNKAARKSGRCGLESQPRGVLLFRWYLMPPRPGTSGSSVEDGRASSTSRLPWQTIMPPKTSSQKPLKPWTLAVYMVADGLAGNSSLDILAETTKDAILNAQAAAGAEDRVHVAIQMDFKRSSGTRRLVARPGTDWIHNARETDAGNPRVLASFLRWVRRQCPAERYVLHFWGHSTGPVGLFFDSAQRGMRPDGLTLPELGYALEQSRPILGDLVDIVLMKDCWLSSLEAVHELRDGARYLVASQTEVPTAVWPYKEVFEVLSTADRSDVVACNLVNVLGDFYDLAPNRSIACRRSRFRPSTWRKRVPRMNRCGRSPRDWTHCVALPKGRPAGWCCGARHAPIPRSSTS